MKKKAEKQNLMNKILQFTCELITCFVDDMYVLVHFMSIQRNSIVASEMSVDNLV